MTDAEKLAGLHPTLIDAHNKMSAAFANLGFVLVPIEGVRRRERQAELFAKGRTTPGPGVDDAHPMGRTVTNAPPGEGPHEIHEDGFGHALDYGFRDARRPTLGLWDREYPWRLLGEMARVLGLRWGGDFRSLPGDLGHVELP